MNQAIDTRPVPLEMLIVFVTRRCNARCAHCFYADSLNDGSSEISLAEYEQIARKAGPLSNILLSGGEPSLRTDLDEIIQIFHRECGVRHVGMPTNGLLPDRIAAVVERALERCPELRMDVNLSLDGLGEQHDKIRGVPGNFVKSMETLDKLAALRERHGRLRVHVETVITNGNARQIPEVLDFIWEHHDANGHFAEVIRGNPPDPSLRPPGEEDLRYAQQAVLDNHRRYREKRGHGPSSLELSLIDHLYQTQRRFLFQGDWPMTCTAGQRIAVIEPTAEVRLCELKGIIGNLRDFDLDLQRLLMAEKAQKLRKWIVDEHCACTHCVFLTQSLAYDPAMRTQIDAQAAPPVAAEDETPSSLGQRARRWARALVSRG